MIFRKQRFNLKAAMDRRLGKEITGRNYFQCSPRHLEVNVPPGMPMPDVITIEPTFTAVRALDEENTWKVVIQEYFDHKGLHVTIDDTYLENASFEETAKFMANIEFGHFRHDLGGKARDFADYVRERGVREEDTHISWVLLRMEKAGQIDLDRLTQTLSGYNARDLARMRPHARRRAR